MVKLKSHKKKLHKTRTACTQILSAKNLELLKLKYKKPAGAMCSITGECM